nr:MAG TPA: hypothetical protein [Caudoviricetes sp.]
MDTLIRLYTFLGLHWDKHRQVRRIYTVQQM